MTNFVDVSNMSDREVKRLCQQDETDVSRQTNRRYARTPAKMYDTDLVFAAAQAVYRKQEFKYVKKQYFGDGTEVTNADLLRGILVEDTSQITQEDYTVAAEIRTHYKGLMMKILAGKVLNEFDSKALALANSEQISERELGTVAYLPVGYNLAKKRQSVDDRINYAQGGYLGSVGDKVSFKAEVLRTVYSQQWQCYFVTAITDKDQVVFFSNKQSFEAGSNIVAQGTVKNHHADGKTQFNRVKIFTTN